MVVHKVVFLRHGESVWNVENIFTGWADVDLSPVGQEEAVQAGKCLKEKGFAFDVVFTSVLKRAVKTAWRACMETDKVTMPVIPHWRLNERHYGGLQGLNKAETAEKHGEAQVKIWRRSYDTPPPEIEPSDPRHPCNDPAYAGVPKTALPGAESLAFTVDRVLPFWNDAIAPMVMAGRSVLVAAHGNSLRALCKHLENMSEKEVLDLNIPTAVPLVYELDEKMNFIRKYYLMDEAEVSAKIAAVKNQGAGGAKAPGLTPDVLSAEPYLQGHLFEGATDEAKVVIAKQLSEIDGKLPGGGLAGYLTRARGLLQDAREGVNPFLGLTPKVPNGQRLTGESGPGTETYAKFEQMGMAQLSKTCFCLVAGGLGERLGYPGIKIGITAEITTGVTFCELYVQYILAFQAHAREATGDTRLELPLAIMTSGDTHEPTVQLLEENGFFGMSLTQIIIMKQEKVPALMDVEAHIAIKGTGSKIETKPHGHGDVHALLYQRGLAAKWAAEGREWLVLFQDTNPLPFRSVCAVLGVSLQNNFVMNSVAVPRIPEEAVGAIVMLENQEGQSLTINVEYNQLGPLLKSTELGGDIPDETGFSPYPGNINILVFKVPEMVRSLDTTGGIVPEFVNPKWADAERNKFKSATRLECMMQDFPRLCGPQDKIGFTQLDRLMCFTCVKNNLADAAKKRPPDCALSAEADMYASNAMLLKLAGTDVEVEAPDTVSFLGISADIGARVILKPSFAVSLEQMKAKVQGKVRISKRSSLVLEGNASIDGLDLDGALIVAGTGVLKDKVVKNAGLPLTPIPDEELSAQPPSYRIRGYKPAEGRAEHVVMVSPATQGIVDKWCSKLPKGRDLTDPAQVKTMQDIADEIISEGVSVDELKQLLFAQSKEYPVMFLSAVLMADSALKLRACSPHHLTIIHAMYNEQDRMKAKAECADGQDFIRVKVAQMSWLYDKYAPAGSSWNYIAVDDGCPNDSGALFEAVVQKEGYKNVEVARLQTGIDEKIPPFNQMSSPKDSRKGGSVLYGLHCAKNVAVGGKRHIAAYFDADLSADLGLCGLLVHPILVEGKKVSVGQRYGCWGSFLALSTGADGHPVSLWNNTDCFRMMFRHFARGILMPALKGVYDTQCAFKAIEVDGLADIVKGINAFGSGFDMELLIVAARHYAKEAAPFGLVPFLFIEDKEGSTMTSNEEAANKSFFNMLKEMIKIHESCFANHPMGDNEKAWIQYFRDIELEGYCKMIGGFAKKLGPTPTAALDYKFDLQEAKGFAEAA